MKVLVTGATGFVGRELISVLAAEGMELTAVGGQRRAKNSIFEEYSNVEFFATDITNEKSLTELSDLSEIDAVIHSAGLAHQFGKTEKEAFEAVNVRGTANIVRLALKLKAKHFILIGSTAVYGVAPSSNGKTDSKVELR